MIFKLFSTISRNDGLVLDFGLFIFFKNPCYLYFLEASLDLCYLFRPVEDFHPESKQLITEAMISLIIGDLELIVKYLPEIRLL